MMQNSKHKIFLIPLPEEIQVLEFSNTDNLVKTLSELRKEEANNPTGINKYMIVLGMQWFLSKGEPKYLMPFTINGEAMTPIPLNYKNILELEPDKDNNLIETSEIEFPSSEDDVFKLTKYSTADDFTEDDFNTDHDWESERH